MINKIKAHKKLIIVIAIAIAAIVIILAVTLKNLGNQSGDGITRYQWIDMLAEQFGMQEYQNEEPYYKDVPTDSEYFAAIQSAKEWGVTDETPTFDGEKKINGEYAALTAMKAIGKYKVMIYLGLDNEPTEKQYLDLAKETGLITEAQLRKSITEEESTAILDRAEELFLRDLWVDDYAKVEYQDGVVELSGNDILEIETDKGIIKVSNDALPKLNEGTIIVYPADENGSLTTGKIKAVKENGEIEITAPEMNEVIDTLVVSDREMVTADAIIESLAEEKTASIMEEEPLSIKLAEKHDPTLQFTTANDNAGGGQITITISADDKGAALSIGGGFSSGELTQGVQQYSVDLGLEEGESIEASINSEIGVSVLDVNYNGMDVENVSVQLDTTTTFTGKVELKTEKKKKLCEPEIPIAGGVMKIAIPIYIVFHLDGSIEFEVGQNVTTTMTYQKGALPRTTTNASPISASLVADCTIGVYVQPEAVLKVLWFFDIVDFDVRIGAEGKGRAEIRTDSDITMCVDITAAAPVIYLYLSGDDEKTTLLSLLNITGEWNPIPAENAPIKFNKHFEWYRNGTSKEVPECTYNKKKTSTKKQGIDDLEDAEYYFLQYEGGYSSTKNKQLVFKGPLYVQEGIPRKELDTIKKGEVYKIGEHEFSYQGVMTYTEFNEKLGTYYDPANDTMGWANQKMHVFKDQDDNIYSPDSPGHDTPEENEWLTMVMYTTLENTLVSTSAYGLVENEFELTLDDSDLLRMMIQGSDHNFSFRINDHTMYPIGTTEWTDKTCDPAAENAWEPGRHYTADWATITYNTDEYGGTSSTRGGVVFK